MRLATPIEKYFSSSVFCRGKSVYLIILIQSTEKQVTSVELPVSGHRQDQKKCLPCTFREKILDFLIFLDRNKLYNKIL